MVSKKRGFVCVFLLMSLAGFAFANIYDFRVFNDSTWENDSRLNFTITISDEGENRVGFLFKNISSIYTSITSIYFDNGPLLALDTSFLQSGEVDYVNGKKNDNLSGGNNLTPPFAKPADFSVNPDSKKGFSRNGINPELSGEANQDWLKVFFTVQLSPPQTSYYQQVIDDITDGDLRIGLHIQSIGGDDGPSVSAINQTTAIPEPATLALLMVGVLLIRKKN